MVAEGDGVALGSEDKKRLADLDRLLDGILVDANGDDEQLTALCQALNDETGAPFDARVRRADRRRRIQVRRERAARSDSTLPAEQRQRLRRRDAMTARQAGSGSSRRPTGGALARLGHAELAEVLRAPLAGHPELAAEAENIDSLFFSATAHLAGMTSFGRRSMGPRAGDHLPADVAKLSLCGG